MSAEDRFKELLRGRGDEISPSDAESGSARAALHRAYRSAEELPPHPWRRPSLGWAIATAAVVLVAINVLPGSTPAVDASLEQIARVARATTSAELPPGAYTYVRSENLVLAAGQLGPDGEGFLYLLPATIDGWFQPTSEQRITTVGTPRFFNSALEAAYYAGGYDAGDGVGETRTDTFTDVANREDITKWSADLETLKRQIAQRSDLAGAQANESIQAFVVIEELMAPTINAPPGLRAALIEVLGGLDVTTTLLTDGSVRVGLDIDEPGVGVVRRELDIDADGFLRAARTILVEPIPSFLVPAGTSIYEATWSRPEVVTGAGVFPTG